MKVKSTVIARILFYLVAIVAFGISAKLLFQHDNSDEEWKRAYLLVTDSTRINHKIKEIYCPPRIRCAGGAAFLIFDDNTKYDLRTRYSEAVPALTEIIAVGDSISKAKGSDSLFVFKNPKGTKFKFVLKRTQ